MPYKIRKVNNKSCYRVTRRSSKKSKQSRRVTAKCTTKSKAYRQVRLLNAIRYNKNFVPKTRP